jgi:hypothetical protein
MRSGRSGAGGDDLANERASRLFFFLCGSFWRPMMMSSTTGSG